MELIIVCSLAGLLLAIAMPTLRNNLMTNQLNSSARKIIGVVKELRHQAIRDHKAYLLHFDLEKQQYWYELDGTVNPFNDEPETLSKIPDGAAITSIKTYSQGNKDQGVATLWISRKGYMDQTVIHLMDDSGDVLSLVFSPFSGAARVYEESVEVETLP